MSAATGRNGEYENVEHGLKLLSFDDIPTLLYHITYCANLRTMMGFGITPGGMKYFSDLRF